MVVRILKASVYESVLGGRINWISRETALRGLIHLAATDRNTKETLAAFGASEADLRELYFFLIKAGAGQWVKNKYVAVVGVTNPVVVYAYLQAKAANELSKNFALNVASACVDYIDHKYDIQVLLKALNVPERVTLKIPN